MRQRQPFGKTEAYAQSRVGAGTNGNADALQVGGADVGSIQHARRCRGELLGMSIAAAPAPFGNHAALVNKRQAEPARGGVNGQ